MKMMTKCIPVRRRLVVYLLMLDYRALLILDVVHDCTKNLHAAVPLKR